MTLTTRAGRVLADLPIVQAPMAGVSTPVLAAAVSEAGALGSLALGAVTPARADALIAAVRECTDRPVNYNVFAHAPPVRRSAQERAWLEALRPQFARYAAEPPAALDSPYASFLENDGLLDVLVARRVEVVSFHFGAPRPDQVERLEAAGAVLVGCATRPEEAVRLEAAGMDLLVLQGAEAGGHRGCFDPEDDPCMPLEALLRATRERVELPLIAAGGLMSGADIAGVLAAGAAGAQLGTAFVCCPESSASTRHRAVLVDGTPETAMTRRISGRPARGIVNGWFEDLEVPESAIPAYPVAYDAGKALAAASAAAGSGRFDVAWAGTGAGRGRALPATELVATLAAELRSAQSPA
ncbi:MAG: nitronate monooxygenase [Pseudomonadales bacterium]|jgi:nitronate monooxygenase|nr:nitronate monooxygenase [Pseudomonadales bacterium]